MVCQRESIATLVAFVWLFSSVRFQMCPQIAIIRRRKVTLIAFVWRLSTMCFQMCPQLPCPNWCKVALVALVWPFSTVRFRCVFKWPVWEGAKSHWLHLFGFSPLCVFKYIPETRKGKGKGLMAKLALLMSPEYYFIKFNLAKVCELKEKWKWNLSHYDDDDDGDLLPLVLHLSEEPVQPDISFH